MIDAVVHPDRGGSFSQVIIARARRVGVTVDQRTLVADAGLLVSATLNRRRAGATTKARRRSLCRSGRRPAVPRLSGPDVGSRHPA
jgi:hypothetical protein